MAEEEPDVPDWINEINPADYVLLDGDLPSDLHVAGDISADAQAAEMAFMKDGKADVERFAFVEVHENICEPDPEGVYDCLGGNYLLSVYVYETVDQARAVWENTIVEQYGGLPSPEGFDHVSNVIAPLDPRFGDEGRCIGPYIWYKNLACTIFGNWDENDNKIASLWLDKVSKTEPVVQVNLKMREGSLVMGCDYDNFQFSGTENYKPLQEIAADKQAVQAQVFNYGDEVAENVYIQFYLQMPGEAEYSKLGEPLLAGDVPPREDRAVYTYWDLEGENVEGAVIGAQAFVPGAVDVNPDDNFISITVNVYYAFNGDRAYSAEGDAYSFENYRFNESKTEELAEELIATVAAGVPPSLEKDLWLRLFFPQTYVRLWDYFNESYRSSAGGHCYGMAATSALYFTDPTLRPAAKKTSEMSKDEASQNIDIYHRAQMIPLVRSLLADESPYFKKSWGTSSYDSQYKTYTKVKRSLKEDRTPLIIEFGGPENDSTYYNQHAVLAYKLVEIEGEHYKQVYIYDSNTLMSDLKEKEPMPVVLLRLKRYYRYSVYSGVQRYPWNAPRLIDANPVFRTIPLQEANALLPGMKEMAKSWIETLKKEGWFAAVTGCPADAIFTDTSGRRVGTIDGRVINEIPEAEVMSSGEVEIYLLPMDLSYSLEITGTGSGLVDFDVINPEGEASAKVVSFTNVSIGAGEKLTSEIADGGEIEDLKSGTSTIEPSLSGVLDLGAEEGSDETAGGDGAEVGTEDEAVVLPTAEQELIFERNSIWAVDNDPTSPTSFTIDREWTVTEIKTYHWNYGQGKAPGMIGLQDRSGSVLGMWPASGLLGSGGVPDAYWTARPNLVLKPGKYTILDSDPATWSQNAETAGEGIAWVYGLPSEGSWDGSGIDSEGLPFTDDFNDGEMDGWTVGGLLGSWTVSAEEGVLRQNSNDFGGSEGAEGSYLGTYVTAGGPSWRDYDFMARVRPVDNDGIGLIFRYEDSSNYYRFLWVGDESSTGPLRRLDRIKGGVQTVLKSDGGEAARYDPGRWYNLEASLDGDVIGVYIDGVLWGEVRDGEIESGGVGLFSYAQVGVEFDDVVVTGAEGSAAGSFSKEAGEAGSSADPGWGLSEYGEILIDAPTGGWEGVIPGEAI